MTSTLATRCPTCSTVFRVVPDQLRVSDGWVRCGRCSEVFNAAEALVDMETGAPRRWDGETPLRTWPRPPSASPAGAGHKAAAGPGLAPLAPAEPAPGDGGDARNPFEAAATAPAGADSDGAAPAGGFTAIAAPGAGDAEPPPLPDLRADGRPGHGGAPPARRGARGAQPSFLRAAERAARWHRPRVRAALALAAVALVLTLLVQIGATYRDLAAARFPQWRPLLAQGCAVLGCRLEPARAIASLEVESSGLVRVEPSSVYRLSVALRNRAGIDLAVPALDLALSDSQGRLVARRVLTAAELGADAATIAAGTGLALRATLQAALPAGEPVAGYTIDLFYP